MSGQDVDYGTTSTAQANRAAKAKAIARYAWRFGIAPAGLLELAPEVGRALAREADVNPPRPTSPTWADAAKTLERMYEGARDPQWAAAAPPQDLRGTVKPWNPDPWGDGTARTRPADGPQAPDDGPQDPSEGRSALAAAQERLRGAVETPEPGPVAAPAPLAAVPEPAEAPEPLPDPVIPAGAPAGWAEHCAQGPLPGGQPCHACSRPATCATGPLLRCPEHPPQPGEWGYRLNWTPTAGVSCAPARCYCGRCDVVTEEAA